MPDNMQIDGIKTLSEEEKKRSREIVLESIGEMPVKKNNNAPSQKKFSNKIDGLIGSKKMTNDPGEACAKEKIDFSQKNDKEVLKTKEKIQEKKESKTPQNIDEKLKKGSGIKKIKSFQVFNRKENKKTFFDEKTQISLKSLEQRINIATRDALYFFGVFFIIILIIYSTFVLITINFNIDNNLFRKASEHVLIPAIITKNGVIDFYQYKDFNQSMGTDADLSNTAIIKKMIMNDLLKRLKIGDPNISKEQIAKKMIYDEGVNKAPLERVRKIKQMIKNGEDFISTSAKYGDRSGQVTVVNENLNIYTYGKEAFSLKQGEISNIIYKPDGYYILKCINKNEISQDISYVFIKAKDLDSYIDESLKNFQYYSLVD